MTDGVVSVHTTQLVDLAGAETKDRVVSVTLNRPDTANAFNAQMIEGITEALAKIKQDPSVRAVLIQGSGKHFSAGADLNWMKESARLTHDQNLREAERLIAMFETLATMPMPTVAVIRGAAYGGAVGIVASCDVAVATETAKFCLSEVRVGILPAVILPYLARKISYGQLRRLALSGRVFTCKEAREFDLIQVSCTTDSVQAVLLDEVNQLMAASPEAQAAFKSLHQQVEDNGRRQGRFTAQAIADVRASTSGQAGLASFLEKVSPPWIRKIPADARLVREAL